MWLLYRDNLPLEYRVNQRTLNGSECLILWGDNSGRERSSVFSLSLQNSGLSKGLCVAATRLVWGKPQGEYKLVQCINVLGNDACDWDRTRPRYQLWSLSWLEEDLLIGPSTRGTQRTVSLDGENGHPITRAGTEPEWAETLSLQAKSLLLTQSGAEPKALSFIFLVITTKVSLIKRHAINRLTLKITAFATSTCVQGANAIFYVSEHPYWGMQQSVHASCDMGQRFQRTLTHVSMSLAGGTCYKAENKQVS